MNLYIGEYRAGGGRARAFRTHLQHVKDRRNKIAKIIRRDRIKLWKSRFDYTDTVKCDGEFFL